MYYEVMFKLTGGPENSVHFSNRDVANAFVDALYNSKQLTVEYSFIHVRNGISPNWQNTPKPHLIG
jgi:hypothetical protein